MYKNLHQPKEIYTGAARGARDKYEVCICCLTFTFLSLFLNHAMHQKTKKVSYLLQHLLRPQYPEPSIGGSNEEPPAGLDFSGSQVQCVLMGLLQVPYNEVRIASDESKLLG